MKRFLAILILLLLPMSAWADSVKIGACDTCTGDIQDNWMRDSEVNYNYGASTAWVIGDTLAGVGGGTRTILRVPTTAIPAGADVTAVTLSALTYFAAGCPSANIHQICPANDGWVEGTANGAAQAGSSCWSYRAYNTTGWAGSAGLSTVASTCTGSTDLDADAFASAATNVLGAWVTWTFNAAGIQAVEDAIGGDFEISVRPTNESNDLSTFFYSSEWTTANQRPYMTVTYTPAATAAPQVITVEMF